MQNYTDLQIADDSAVVNKSDIFLNRCNDRLFAQYPKKLQQFTQGRRRNCCNFYKGVSTLAVISTDRFFLLRHGPSVQMSGKPKAHQCPCVRMFL